MRIKIAARVAAVVASALVAVACATPDVAPVATIPAPVEPGDTAPAAPAGVEQTLNISAVEGITTTNTMLPHGNSSHVQNIMWLTNGPSFQFFDEGLNTVRNTDFGAFSPETTAFNEDGTLTVTYTINEGVTWSDGVPVDAADMILFWGAQNNRFTTITEEEYEAQYADGDTDGYIPLPDGVLFFPGGSTGMTDVAAFPVISDDGRTVTFTFDNPRSDWFFQFGVSPVPAHVVGRLAFGIDDPIEAKQAVITAFGGPDNYRAQDGTEVPMVETTLGRITDPGPNTPGVRSITYGTVDADGEPTRATYQGTYPTHEAAQAAAADLNSPSVFVPGVLTTFVAPNVSELAEISETLQTAFEIGGSLPADPSRFLSRGPFVMAEIQDGQFIRLERNPNFTAYGNIVPRPTMDEITVRIIPDAMGQAQALQNVEVDIINPTTDADIVSFLAGLNGIEVEGTTEGVFEHVTLIQNNGGVFDPAHWAALGVADPEAAARAVRVAFLMTIPREQIVNLLIDPAAPGATPRDSWLTLPGSSAYASATQVNGIDNLANATADDARELLVDAGLESYLPIDVRFLYAVQNPRRAQQYTLIHAAAPDLFNVVDEGDETWGVRMRANPGSFDAALFAWASTSPVLLNSESNTFTGGFNNIGGFSDPRVDALWLEARQTTNQARLDAIAAEIDTILFEDGFGIPLFQHPGLIAWRDDVQNVSSIAVAPTVHWNFYDWMRTAEN